MNRLTCAAIFAAFPLAAFAETPEGFSYSGFVELESLSGMGDSSTFGIGKADLSYRAPAAGISWGFDIGLDAISFDGFTDHAVTGGLVLGFGAGQLVIGAPRAPMELFLNTPVLGGSRAFSYEFAGLGTNLLLTQRLFSGDLLAGFRYDHDFGATDISFALFEQNGERLAEFALRHQIGNLTFVLGGDTMNGGDAAVITAAVTADYDRMDLGLVATRLDNVFGGGANLTSVFISYDITDRLTATGSLLTFTNSKIGTLFGVSAEYEISPSFYLRAGVVSPENWETAYDISLGAKF